MTRHPILTMPTQKNFDQLLIFVNLHHHAKKQLFNLFILQVQSVWVPSPGWAHPFLTRPSPKIFNHILICMNFYQHTKNQLIPSVHSWDQLVLESRGILVTPILDHAQPKDFQSTSNIYEFVSTSKKMRLFHWLVLEK